VTRLAVLLDKQSVDSRLLTGELSPDRGTGKARAKQLLKPRHRERVADALRDLVEEGQRDRPSFFNANLLVNRLAIRMNHAMILTLAREVEELPVVNPVGVIRADRLVTDGESPAYYRDDDYRQLGRAVERARAELAAV